MNWISSEVLRDGMARFVKSDVFLRSQRRPPLVAACHAGFLGELDLFGDEAKLADDPAYREFLWPVDLGWCAATAMQVPTDDSLFLTIKRDRARGPVEPSNIQQLDALRPHIARSALLPARSQLERARVASETLALLGLPALVIDGKGRVIMADALVEALRDRIRWRAQDRISLRDAAADALFQQALSQLDADMEIAVRTCALRKTEVLPEMIAHLGTVARLGVQAAIAIGGRGS